MATVWAVHMYVMNENVTRVTPRSMLVSTSV